VRFPNNPVAFAIVPQMAAPRNVSKDQNISLRLLCRPVQQLRDIAAIDDDFGLRAHFLLKPGDLFGGGAHNCQLPHGVDMGSARAVDLHAGRDVDERKRRIDGRSHLRGQ